MWHDETAIPLVLVHDETSHPHCSRFRILIEAQLLVFRMLLFSFVTLGYPIQSYIFFCFRIPIRFDSVSAGQSIILSFLRIRSGTKI